MNTQTSLVAEQVRLRQWAEQIRDCQNRPDGLKVDDWCHQHGITKANYYYRLNRVRKACLNAVPDKETTFVELPAPETSVPSKTMPETAAILYGAGRNITVELRSCASEQFIKNLIGALAYAE